MSPPTISRPCRSACRMLTRRTWKNDLAAGWLAASYQLMKQDKAANASHFRAATTLERRTDNGVYFYEYYYDPLIRDSTVLYLLAKHFPDRAKALSPRVLENIARPLQNNQFNTLSAAMTMLALDVYANANAARPSRNSGSTRSMPMADQTHRCRSRTSCCRRASGTAGHGSPVREWQPDFRLVCRRSGRLRPRYPRECDQERPRNRARIYR